MIVGLVVAVALSGCTDIGGNDAPRPPPSVSSEETRTENETVAPPLMPTTHIETIQISGRLGTAILVNTAATLEDVVVEDDDRFFPLESAGEPTFLDVNLSWDDPKGIFDTLRLGLAWGCSDDVCTGYDYAQGGSPLNYVNQSMGGDQAIWLFVFVPNSSPAPGLGLYLRSDVDFVLEGEVRSVEA